jgi:hypothetical protein
LSVDSAGNVVTFGIRSVTDNNAYALKLTSSGAFSTAKYFYPAYYGAQAVKDSSDNYYVADISVQIICCATVYYYEVLKLDSSLNKIGGTHTNLGGGYASPTANPIIDSSGNIWLPAYEISAYYSGIAKFNPALNSSTSYGLYYNTGCDKAYFASVAATSSTSFIGAGGRAVTTYCGCCSYNTYTPLLQSFSTTNPLATPNWQVTTTSTNTVTGFTTAAIDSSGNIYTNLLNDLFKFNSSGVLQWKYSYTGITDIRSIAFDSSGGIYVVGENPFSGVTILRIQDNGSTATIDYSRTLTPATGSISFQAGYYNNYMIVSGSTMYITAAYSGKQLTFKVPTNGTLTGIISVGGVNFTYAAGATTQSTATSTFTTTNYPMASSGTTTLSTSLISPSALTPSQAVTVL